MRVARSAFVGSGRPALAAVNTTDLLKQAVAEELERQRPGLDALTHVRAVAIRVALPPVAAGLRPGTRAVRLSIETERSH